MEHNIQILNYQDNTIQEIEKSSYFDQASFITTPDSHDSGTTLMNEPPDIVIIFMEAQKQNALNKITEIKKKTDSIEIIAAVTGKNTETGVLALQNGASDFMILPTSVDTFDFYINRAVERIYLQAHRCFNDNCYKSRFARSQKNYQQLFNEVPCFIYVQDADYQITDANKKFEAYFGHHIGEYCFGICKNRDEPCSVCPIQQTFKDGSNHASEMEIISSDGVKHIVLSWTAPIRDSNGEISNVLVMLTDITEARRLEDHLTSLGFMIGSISHGIKGLLTNLDGAIYLMQKGLNSNQIEQIKEGFDLACETTSRIKKLVLDILYYTKTRTLEWKRKSCKEFMEDTIKIVSRNAKKHQVNITRKLEILTPDDDFEIDETSLQAAMVNILENAIEACSDNKECTRHSIVFTARVDREKVLFKIQDNGPGMEPGMLNNIFTIFFSSKGNKGTGLGLFIANKVISQHRGEIKVRSARDQGTRFLIKIPRTIPHTAKNPRGVEISDKNNPGHGGSIAHP